MENLVKIIGEVVVALVIVIIPILTACSFCLNWLDESKFFLMLLLIGDLVLVGTMVDNLTRR